MLRHSTTLQVRFYEVDPYQHVNHAVYLSYFETARIEALESIGMGLDHLAELGYRIVVTNVDVAFVAPVLMGERVRVDTNVVELRRATMRWHQEIHNDAGVAVAMDMRAAVTDSDGRPVRVPEFLVGALSA